MSLHADEGNGFPLTRLHHFPAVLRATNLQLPVAVILSSTIYTKLDAITLTKKKKTIWRNGKKETVSDSGELQLHSNGGKLSSRKPGQWFVQKPYDLGRC